MAGVLSLSAELARMRLSVLRRPTPEARLGRWICWPLLVAGFWLLVLVPGDAGARHDVLLLGLTALLLGWTLGPVFVTGSGMLRPDWFRLLPLDRRELGAALLAASLVGFGPAATALALAAMLVCAGPSGVAATVITVVSVPVLVLLLAALSRTVYALVGSAMSTRLGVAVTAVQYAALLAVATVGWMLIGPFGSGVRTVFTEGLPDAAGGTLEALPVAWPLLAARAAATGAPLTALGWLAALAGVTAALVTLCVALLMPRASGRRGGARVRRLRGGWLLRRLPATPTGAVAAKEIRQWWRDPWRSLELQCACWLGVLLLLIAWWTDEPQLMAFAGLAVTVSAALSGCNLLGQDGTAIWLTVVGQNHGTAHSDIRGRQLALLILVAPPALLLAVVGAAFSGLDWAWLTLAALPATLGTGIGMGVLLSVVAATPGLDPRHRVGPNDSGDVTYQAWIAIGGMAIGGMPTALLLIPAATGDVPWLAWVVFPVGLANGLFFAWLLGGIAARRLDARLPETFVRLRYGKTVALAQHTSDGGGLLDHMERAALNRNQDRTPAGG